MIDDLLATSYKKIMKLIDSLLKILENSCTNTIKSNGGGDT